MRRAEIRLGPWCTGSGAMLGLPRVPALTSSTCSSVASSGRSAPNDVMPTSSQAFFLLRT